MLNEKTYVPGIIKTESQTASCLSGTIRFSGASTCLERCRFWGCILLSGEIANVKILEFTAIQIYKVFPVTWLLVLLCVIIVAGSVIITFSLPYCITENRRIRLGNQVGRCPAEASLWQKCCGCCADADTRACRDGSGLSNGRCADRRYHHHLYETVVQNQRCADIRQRRKEHDRFMCRVGRHNFRASGGGRDIFSAAGKQYLKRFHRKTEGSTVCFAAGRWHISPRHS